MHWIRNLFFRFLAWSDCCVALIATSYLFFIFFCCWYLSVRAITLQGSCAVTTNQNTHQTGRLTQSFTTHSSSLFLKHASMLTKNTSMSVIRDGLNIFYFYSGHFSFRLILSLGAVFILLQPEQEQQPVAQHCHHHNHNYSDHCCSRMDPPWRPEQLKNKWKRHIFNDNFFFWPTNAPWTTTVDHNIILFRCSSQQRRLFNGALS